MSVYDNKFKVTNVESSYYKIDYQPPSIGNDPMYDDPGWCTVEKWEEGGISVGLGTEKEAILFCMDETDSIDIDSPSAYGSEDDYESEIEDLVDFLNETFKEIADKGFYTNEKADNPNEYEDWGDFFLTGYLGGGTPLYVEKIKLDCFPPYEEFKKLYRGR